MVEIYYLNMMHLDLSLNKLQDCGGVLLLIIVVDALQLRHSLPLPISQVHTTYCLLCHFFWMPSTLANYVRYINELCLLQIVVDVYAMFFDTPRRNHHSHVHICGSMSIVCMNPKASFALHTCTHKINSIHAKKPITKKPFGASSIKCHCLPTT